VAIHELRGIAHCRRRKLPMNIRLLKVILVISIALLCLFYAAQNVVNIGVAKAVVGTVMSMEGHDYYPASFGPAVTSPLLIAMTTWLIIALEIAAGVLAAWGAWDMWKERKSDAFVFNASKKRALLGTGIGVFVWLGLFGAIGGAYFQMWQTDLGSMSLEGAFQYTMMCGLVLLFVNQPDE
jgi:predicted small integral membrane protein